MLYHGANKNPPKRVNGRSLVRAFRDEAILEIEPESPERAQCAQRISSGFPQSPKAKTLTRAERNVGDPGYFPCLSRCQ